MLRALLLVLLLANAVLLAARQGWLGDVLGPASEAEREPLRISRQVNPAVVQVLPPAAASAALRVAAASAAQVGAAASVGEAAAAAASTAAASSPGSAPADAPGARASDADKPAPALACVEAGPLTPAELPAAERLLTQAGLTAGSWQVLAAPVPGGFMVYMGRYPDQETLQRKLDELGRLRLQGQPPPDGLDLQPGINLGRFDDRAAANAALAQMVQRGVRTARVVALPAPQRGVRLRVPQADASTRLLLSGLKLPAGQPFNACPAGATAGAATPAIMSQASNQASNRTANQTAPR